jgi:murein DD-endopeptidase MepM/ murein hydrolase activator NlpD
MKIRGQDVHGSGAYLAKRGSRLHHGVDLVTEINEPIKSFCCGIVSKIGYPYEPTDKGKGHFRYVQVTDLSNIKVRVFYINPLVRVGDTVHKGEIIGTSQDLTQVYPCITQHIHFEVKKTSAFLNPLDYLKLEE